MNGRGRQGGQRGPQGGRPQPPAQTEAKSSGPSQIGFFGIAGLIILATILVLGLFYVIELVGTDQSSLKKALIKVVSSVVTVFATYFLVNRAIRQRERESDVILVSFVGYIDYLVQTFRNTYGRGPQDDEDCAEHMNHIRGREWRGIEQYSSGLGITTNTLPRFLIDSVSYPSYLRSAEEQLLDINDSCRQITSLLGVCSPRLATAAMKVADSYSDLFKDSLPVIRRGLRGFRKLEWFAKYCPYIQDGQFHQECSQDINESIAAVLEGLQYVFQRISDELEDELRESLDEFRKNLPKRYHENYDDELEDVGEVWDQD